MSRQIAALFVEAGGIYFGLNGVDPYDVSRDARFYPGPHPVIAHPPCERWSRLANVVQARYGSEYFRIGDDGKCFERALMFVDKYGGVLEQPIDSMAFKKYGIDRPRLHGLWIPCKRGGFVAQVAQSAYGHRATKLTWLYCNHVPRESLPELRWEIPRGTLEIGGKSSKQGKRKMMAPKERKVTPIEFRDMLIQIARSVEHE